MDGKFSIVRPTIPSIVSYYETVFSIILPETDDVSSQKCLHDNLTPEVIFILKQPTFIVDSVSFIVSAVLYFQSHLNSTSFLFVYHILSSSTSLVTLYLSESTRANTPRTNDLVLSLLLFWHVQTGVDVK